MGAGKLWRFVDVLTAVAEHMIKKEKVCLHNSQFI